MRMCSKNKIDNKNKILFCITVICWDEPNIHEDTFAQRDIFARRDFKIFAQEKKN